jgi:hypothetical protein
VCRQRSVSMDVRWRERDWEPLREEVAEARPAVRASLAASGLLKFFECPLIRAQEYLLQFLIEMWSPEQHCFLVRGEQVAFTAVEDIYFLTGLPFRGTPLPAVPVLPRGTDLEEVAERFFSGEHYMTGSSVRIRAIDVLLHRCVAAMIVRVYRTRAPHRISGGELILMERVVVGRSGSPGVSLFTRRWLRSWTVVGPQAGGSSLLAPSWCLFSWRGCRRCGRGWCWRYQRYGSHA